VIAVIGGGLLTGCGGGNREAGQALSKKSIVDKTPSLSSTLITPQDLVGWPSGSVQRAFLNFWSALQYQDLSFGVNTYDPRLRSVIATAQISQALQSEASFYRSVKPRIVSVTRDHERMSVRYLARDPSGEPAPYSMTWEPVGSGWLIFYDSFLSEALRNSAQMAAQIALDPTAQLPSKQAIQAGYEASLLPSQYLQNALGHHDGHRGGGGAKSR